MYHAPCFPQCIFTLYFPCLPFFLIDHNQLIHQSFRKRPIIGQLNVQAAVAEKEE